MQNLRLVSKELVLFTRLKTNCQQHNWDTFKKNQFRSRVLIQIWKQFFVNTPLHHDLSIRWFTFCLLWRQAYGEVFIHASECTCAIVKEILHYRQVFTSTIRTVYSCFPMFGCTSFKMNGVHSMQPLHFYPISPSTLLL